MRFTTLFCLLFFAFGHLANAEVIKGEVLDGSTGLPLENVTITNVYTKTGIVTGADGSFFITGTRDELLEFRKLGYKIVRIRVPGMVPPHFKIIMQPGEIELPEFELYANSRSKDYKTDSTKYGELYKHILDFPKMSTIDMMRSPFSALSKSNRQKWAFQEYYTKSQQEKYVDYAFNDKLLTTLTGFTGDTLRKFKMRYTPSYEQVKNMNEYSFMQYIKQSADRFRKTFARQRNPG